MTPDRALQIFLGIAGVLALLLAGLAVLVWIAKRPMRKSRRANVEMRAMRRATTFTGV